MIFEYYYHYIFLVLLSLYSAHNETHDIKGIVNCDCKDKRAVSVVLIPLNAKHARRLEVVCRSSPYNVKSIILVFK